MNIPNTAPTLEQRIIGVMRMRRYSRATEQGYVGWYKRYVLFQKEVCGQMRHPAEMGAAEVEAFLTHLAVNRNVSASTQNQALNALVLPLGPKLRLGPHLPAKLCFLEGGAAGACDGPGRVKTPAGPRGCGGKNRALGRRLGRRG